MNRPLIVVGIINWNGWKHSILCIESLIVSDYPNFRVILLDNASSDDSIEMLRQWGRSRTERDSEIASDPVEDAGPFPAQTPGEMLGANVYLMSSSENLGFSGGCNLLARAASRMAPDYLWLLNNDATVARDTMSELMRCALHNRDAIVGSLVLGMVHGEVEFSRGRLPNDFFGFTPWRSSVRDEPFWHSDWVTFASVVIPFGLIQRRLASDGYILDERLFMYVEDVEFCLYARSLGVDIVVCRAGSVRHQRSGSSVGRASVRPYYYITRNRLLVARKWFKTSVRLMFEVYYLASRPLLQLWHLAHGRWSVVSAIWEGIADGRRGRVGKWRRH